MKNLTILIGLFILVSCSPSKEELLISDFEQTIGNTKTNLNLKFNKLEFIKNITWKDSLDFYIEYFEKKRDEKINELEESIQMNKNILNTITIEPIKIFKSKEFEIENKKKQSQIDLYKSDCKGTFLEEVYSIINTPNLNRDSILSKVYDVVYTIKNPMLNNVEQTISKTYYLNSDLTKILDVSIN